MVGLRRRLKNKKLYLFLLLPSLSIIDIELAGKFTIVMDVVWFLFQIKRQPNVISENKLILKEKSPVVKRSLCCFNVRTCSKSLSRKYKLLLEVLEPNEDNKFGTNQ